MIKRTYSELILLPTFEERFGYLKLSGGVSDITFGSNRYFNQRFYQSQEWKRIRDYIIFRDNGCDLGVVGHDIGYMPIVHHINPITINDISKRSFRLLDPENLITVSYDTHNAIHYGNKPPVQQFVERKPNDTCPWKK